MAEQSIRCPHCKREIPLTEVITKTIREKLQLEYEAKLEQKEQK